MTTTVSHIARLIPAGALVALLLLPTAAHADSRPGVQTTAPTAVADTSATLTGRVQPIAGATSYRFEYGTTGYTNVTPTQAMSAGSQARTVSAVVSGLAPGTLHRFRVVAWYSWNSGQDAVGAEQTFTTTATASRGAAPTAPGTAAPAPAPSASPAPAQGGSPAAPGPAPATGGPTGLPSASAPAPLPPAAADAQPVLGRSILVAPVRGTVTVRIPGASGFAALSAGSSVPVGAVVDARGGTIELTTALAGGRVQAGRFGGTVFQVTQAAAGRGMTDLVLRGGDFGACPHRGAHGRAAGADRRRRPVRRLWGEDAGGRFRTRGRNSVAVVRGTKWVTTETCAGTRTTVTEGAVAVRDLGRRRSVLVRAGHTYLAAALR
ncbi:MAG: hypothetical protein QOF29_291 [bacterium]|jgi:hypothetical protein